MRRLSHCILIVTILGSWLPVSIVQAAAVPSTLSTEFVPSWFSSTSNSGAPLTLPGWFSADVESGVRSSATPEYGVASGQIHSEIGANVFPDVIDANAVGAPSVCPLLLDIPLSLLSVEVIGPPVASLGSPVGAGEVYTAVIQNNSAETAYGFYLTATHPDFFVYDGGDRLVHSLFGNVPLSPTVFSTSIITWTPAIAMDLTPGQAITLNFKLRATCAAESGQQMRVGIHYDADPDADPVAEVNTGGLNITTGRGNLVISKSPALQNLGTPDFGEPITWTVTVQNTGLGTLYDAIITDTGGIALGQPSGDLVPSATIPELGVNETRSYTVVGTVEACNFTNVAQASWICGNKVGDATVITPLQSTASVLFTPQVPNVNVQVSSPITLPYCTSLTRTVTITLANSGGPAGDFRLDSTFESDGFWEVIPASLGSDWTYTPGNGVFDYLAGTPAGTFLQTAPGDPMTLTFDVRPQSTAICAAGAGDIAFTPLYADICSSSPFTGNPASLVYQYAQGDAPSLAIEKSGPPIVAVGDVFTYEVTVSGQNANYIGGPVDVYDFLPAEFTLVGPVVPSSGVVITAGQAITWIFTPVNVPGAFTETLTYAVQAITTTGGVCGASQVVANAVEVNAIPMCPGCPPLYDTDDVQTAIENNEGISPGHSVVGSFEVCGTSGFQIVNNYEVLGSTVITWNGAVFTEALGTSIGAGALPGSGLFYVPGSLSITVGGVDYTAVVTPVTATGQLVIDLSPLAAAGALTQNLTLFITYTLGIPEEALSGAVEQTFLDWSQLFLPGLSDNQACAANNSFNQVLNLTISRGDLSVGLAPRILDRCNANPVVLTVNDNIANRLTDHIVVTFTASTEEIATARNFSFHGSLTSIAPITIISDTSIGGGRGMITFTLPTDADLNGDGEIHFEMDMDCGVGDVWHAGVEFQSRCGIVHGHTTERDHLYREAGLLLFATPIQYTVREKEVIWKFFVTNNGNLTATNVLVTNDLAGLSVLTYTPDSPAGISAAFLPASAVFTITELAPNEQREITVTAEVIACDPLFVDITAEYGCFGTVCSQPTASISFDTPDPYLLTNNGQSADLPMCDIGEVIFTTKNASSDVHLYQLNITETLLSLSPVPGAPMTMTILDETNSPVAVTTAFTPEIVVSGLDTQLIWRAISAPTEVMTWFNALPPLNIVRIQVPVVTTCDPPNTPQSFAAASARGPCGKHLGYTEDAVTLKTLKPDMTVEKRGSVDGVNFYENIYATPGQTVTWRLEVENLQTARSYVAHNVVLSDTWPFNFSFYTATVSTTQPITPYIVTASRTITWDIGDMAPGDALVFYITGTVSTAANVCNPQTLNRTRLSFGCDDGCASAIVPQDTARLRARPDLITILSPDPVAVCEGEIPITVRNRGATAYSATLTVTLPSNYVYSHTVGYSLTPTLVISDSPTFSQPQFLWDTIPGHDNAAPYEFTITLKLRNSGITGTCPMTSGLPIATVLTYEDHPVCAASGPFTSTSSESLEVQIPELELTKTPIFTVAQRGDIVTWTLRLTNTSEGPAPNIIVTDTIDPGFSAFTASLGSGGEVPYVDLSNRTITWALASDMRLIPAVTERITLTQLITTTRHTVETLDTVTVTVQTQTVPPPTLISQTVTTDYGSTQSMSTISNTFWHTAPLTLPPPDFSNEILDSFISSTTTIDDGSVMTMTTVETATRQVTSTVVTVEANVLFEDEVTITPEIPANWQATVTATVGYTGTRLRNNVEARGDCNSGCEHSVISDTAYVSLLSGFDKGPDLQTGTIGSLVVFTFTGDIDGLDFTYEDVLLTDTLPAGLGYIASTLVYTEDLDASDGGPTATRVLAPNAITDTGLSTLLVWDMGTLSGTVLFNGVVTTVVENTSVNFDGAQHTNDLLFTYREYGSDYTFIFTDTADVDIVEPILHLGKSYITPYGCGATLFQDNFNDGDAAGWTGGGGWTVQQGTYQRVNNNGSRYAPGNAGTDFSFSAMIRAETTADARALPGLYFRRQDNNNYYRVYWSNPTQLQLRRRVNGNNNNTNVDYPIVPGMWYHFEVQAVGDQVWIYVNGELLFAESLVHPTRGLVNSGQVGIFSGGNNNSGTRAVMFDDILVTRMDDVACYVGAGDHLTYTLTISNQGRLPGYDLVVTDSLPSGMALVSYTYTSDDPGTLHTVEPAPIPGAMGDLIWEFNQLTSTVPYDPQAHTALTLTLVLSVSEAITANTVMANQAFLRYDNWLTDTQPTTVTREYSGGSHSTAIRTVDGGITKTAMTTPPPTATLGSLVTYTLMVPHPVISAALYDVLITDVVDSRVMIEAVTTDGGTGALSGWTGQSVSATFASIPAYTRAFVTVTGRISDTWPNASGDADAGDVLTNTALMSHTTSALITRTNEVSTVVGEPALVLVKNSAPPTSNTVGAGDLVTYSVVITNQGHANGGSPAYDLAITDTLPLEMRDAAPVLVDVTLDGAGVDPTLMMTGYNTLTGLFTVVFTNTFAFSVPVGSALRLSYVAEVNADVAVGLDLSNAAEVTWSSLPGIVPGDRDYEPVGDNTTVHTVLPELSKSVTPVSATLGDIITYSIQVPASPISATVYNAVITDTLDARLQLISVLDGPDGSIDTDGNTLTVTYPAIPAGTYRLITVTAILSDPLGALNGENVANRATLSHTTGVTESDTPIFTVVEPALSLVKTSTPPTSNTVGAGDLITYRVVITNIGTSPAYDLVISDTLPSHVTLFDAIPVSLDVDGITLIAPTDYISSYTGGVLNLDFTDTYSLPVGAVLTLVYHGRVAVDVPAREDQINVVTTMWSSLPGPVPGDRDYGPLNGTTNVHAGVPDLVVSKLATPADVVRAGDWLTYTLVVTNTGVVSATGVVVTDHVPVGTTFVTATMPHNGPLADVISWPLGVMGVSQSELLTMVVAVNTDVTTGTAIVNTAWVTSNEQITGTDTVTTPVETNTNLQISKSAVPYTLTPGLFVTYTLVYTNIGPSDALAVYITDTLPSGLNFGGLVSVVPPMYGPTQTGQLLTWYTPTLTAGASGSVVFTALVDAGVTGTLTNYVAITTTTPETSSQDNDDDVSTPTESHVDLVVVKHDTPDPVVAGTSLTYTIVYTNNGPSDAWNVCVTDTLPAEVEFGAMLSPLGAWSGPTLTVGPPDLVTWCRDTLSVGVYGSLVFTVTVSPDALGQITNTAVISGDGTDDNPDNNDDDEPTDITTTTQLQITKSADPDPVYVLDVLTYTLVYTNTGPSAARDVFITDTLPSGVTFGGEVSVVPPLFGPTLTGQMLTWYTPTLAANATGSVVFTVTVDPDAGSVLQNCVAITTTTPETDTVDNEDDTFSTVLYPDLTVRKDVTPVVALPVGSVVTWTIVYSNVGGAPAYEVSITDTLPLSVTYGGLVSVAPPLGGPAIDPGPPTTVTWVTPTLSPGAFGIIVFTTTTEVATSLNAVLTNSVSISTTTPETDTTNNDDEAQTPLVRLSVDKRVARSPVLVGEAVSFTLLLTNTGAVPLDTVVVTDTYDPFYLDFVSATPPVSSTSPGWMSWTDVGPLEAGQSTQIVITYTALRITDSTTNWMTATSTVSDTQLPSSSDDDDVAIVYPALSVTKASASDGGAPLQPGERMTYTIVIENTGGAAATGVVVSDTLPTHTDFVPGSVTIVPPSAGGVLGTPPILATGLTVAARSSVTVEYAVTVHVPLTPGTSIRNAVMITSTESLTASDEITDTVVAFHTLAITKTAALTAVAPGRLLTYTLAWQVGGDAPAAAVTISDTVPQRTSYVTCDGGLDCDLMDDVVSWSLGDQLPPASGTVTMVVLVDAQILTHTQILNTAVITDRDQLSDTDTVTTLLLLPGMTLAKHVLADVSAPNAPITYVIVITNTGDLVLDPVTLTDTLPTSDFHYLAGTGIPSDPDSNVGTTLIWENVGPLLPGDVLTVSFAVTVTPGITGTFWNVVLGEGDYGTGTITDTDDAPVSIQDPAIALVKRLVDFDQDLTAPNAITFTIQITNTGPSVIEELPMWDQYDPTYLSFLSATPMPDEPEDDGLLTWYDLTAPPPPTVNGFGRDLMPTESFVITTVFHIVQTIQPPLTTTNHVSVAGVLDEYDNDANEDEDSVVISGTVPTAVDLHYFQLVPLEQAVRLEWATTAEVDNFGFRIRRATEPVFSRAVDLAFIPSQCRDSLCGATYDYVDEAVVLGEQYWYWLSDVDTSGLETHHGPLSTSFGVLAGDFLTYLPLIMKR